MKRDTRDRKFSKFIRERDGYTCQRCGAEHLPNSRGLHTAHCFSRGKTSTRFDPENAVALCYGCHRYLDQRPTEKFEWFESRLGTVPFEALRLRSNHLAGQEGYGAGNIF